MSDLSTALLKAAAIIQCLEDHGHLNERKWTISKDEPWITVEANPSDDRLSPYRFKIICEKGEVYSVGPEEALSGPIFIGEGGCC